MTFTLNDVLALTGLAQCLLILIYILFRMKSAAQVAVALGYFASLAGIFALEFASRLDAGRDGMLAAQWALGALLPPFCYLLILQIAGIRQRNLWVFLPALAGFAAAWIFARDENSFTTLHFIRAMTGSVVMLALFAHRAELRRLLQGKQGREKYWLIQTLAGVTVFSLAVDFFTSESLIAREEEALLRVIAALVFAYLATTTLFRVYPPPLELKEAPRAPLDEAEQRLAAKIVDLMTLDKLYQEKAFSRADLARELQVSEATVTRVINAAFNKSFTSLLNDFRLAEAQRLLRETDMTVSEAASESGFNSPATFNRVFRESTGQSPSVWRDEHKTARGKTRGK